MRALTRVSRLLYIGAMLVGCFPSKTSGNVIPVEECPLAPPCCEEDCWWVAAKQAMEGEEVIPLSPLSHKCTLLFPPPLQWTGNVVGSRCWSLRPRSKLSRVQWNLFWRLCTRMRSEKVLWSKLLCWRHSIWWGDCLLCSYGLSAEQLSGDDAHCFAKRRVSYGVSHWASDRLSHCQAYIEAHGVANSEAHGAAHSSAYCEAYIEAHGAAYSEAHGSAYRVCCGSPSRAPDPQGHCGF